MTILAEVFDFNQFHFKEVIYSQIPSVNLIVSIIHTYILILIIKMYILSKGSRRARNFQARLVIVKLSSFYKSVIDLFLQFQSLTTRNCV